MDGGLLNNLGALIMGKDIDELIKEAVDNYNKSHSESGKILIGLVSHKVESKETLKERLKALAKIPKNDLPLTGAMCYSPGMRYPETLTHTCPNCGREYEYSSGFFGSSKTHGQIQEEISQIVEKIKSLGYDIYVKHMCELCYAKEFGTEPVLREYYSKTKFNDVHMRENSSVSVLYFRFNQDEEYVRNVVSLEQCERLYDFINGNNVYLNEYDEIMLLKDYSNLIKHLMGL